MNRVVRVIDVSTIQHKNELTKVRHKGVAKMICYANEVFSFKIDNFYVKEYDSNGHIQLYTKNKMHNKIFVIQKIFDDIENDIIDKIEENKKKWCNGQNIPRYQIEMAYVSPCKIKNNETIIYSTYDTQSVSEDFLENVFQKKVLVQCHIEYHGFELTETDITPIFSICKIKEMKSYLKMLNVLSDSTTEEINDMMYPTDIECPENNTDTNTYNENENDNYENNLYHNDTNYLNPSETIENKESQDSENNKTLSSNISITDDTELQLKSEHMSISNTYVETPLPIHTKKTPPKNPKKNIYITQFELKKTQKNKELSKMLDETRENGYISQYEKASQLKLKSKKRFNNC